MNTSQMNESFIPLTKGTLSRIRIRAIRGRIWFKVLNRLERASVDLTIKVVEKVRSQVLRKMLTLIVEKLLKAMESKATGIARQVGVNLARKISLVAQKWGNKSAVKWNADPEFIRYWTITYMNTPVMFKP